MGFTTRCCKRLNLTLHRALRALTLGAAALVLLYAGLAHAEGVEVRHAAVKPVEGGYVLEADFGIQLSLVLDDALHKGVPLYFMFEFELIRPRWYWANEKLATVQQQQRLSFNTLTRQYRVGVGTLYQNFSTLREALNYMSRMRRRLEMEPGALRRGDAYPASLRFRLDQTQLPKPFLLHTGRDWTFNSDWYRWTVSP